MLAVADGLHSFRVRAVDAAGNTSPVVERKWDVDLIGSTIAITSPVAGASYVRGEAVLAVFTCQDLPTADPHVHRRDHGRPDRHRPDPERRCATHGYGGRVHAQRDQH